MEKLLPSRRQNHLLGGHELGTFRLNLSQMLNTLGRRAAWDLVLLNVRRTKGSD